MRKINKLKKVLFGKGSAEVWGSNVMFFAGILILTIFICYGAPYVQHLLVGWKYKIKLISNLFFVMSYLRLGLETWGGESNPERLQEGLFWFYVIIGYVLLVISDCLDT